MTETLRARLSEAQKAAMKARDKGRLSALRLILAAIKQRDIDYRVKPGYENGIAEDEILQVLQSMIKQRRESVIQYQRADRIDLADVETAEIAVIEEFLPRQMDADEIAAAARAVIVELGVTGPQEMGKVMAALKQKYAGRMDFGKVSPIVKRLLLG
jgi:uncharacterized protein YqeY